MCQQYPSTLVVIFTLIFKQTDHLVKDVNQSCGQAGGESGHDHVTPRSTGFVFLHMMSLTSK